MYPRQIRHEYIIILYQAKLTRTKVTIAVYGTNYLSRAKLMLIPAKNLWWNSSGLVINEMVTLLLRVASWQTMKMRLTIMMILDIE